MGGGFRDGGAGVSMEDDDDEYQEVREKGCNIMYIYTCTTLYSSSPFTIVHACDVHVHVLMYACIVHVFQGRLFLHINVFVYT